MYDLVPTKEFAIESINWPLTPKSHSLISPRELTNMFDGFTSVEQHLNDHCLYHNKFALKAIKATSYLWHSIFSFVLLQKGNFQTVFINEYYNIIVLASVDYFVVIPEIAQSFKNL